MAGEPCPPCHSLASSLPNKPPKIEIMPVSRFGITKITYWHHNDHGNASSSCLPHTSLQMTEQRGFYKKQSFLAGKLRQSQLSLQPNVDFFTSFCGRALCTDSLVNVRPWESTVFTVLCGHWGLFPWQLVEMKWTGFRECQESPHLA